MPSFAPRALSGSLPFAAVLLASLTLGGPAAADPASDPCDTQIFRVEHSVPIGAGRSLHVTETFSPRSLQRHGPHRAIVMLPGPVSQGNLFNIDVPGYDGGAIMAQRGFFAYAVDFEGTGTSTYPADGTAVTLESQVDAVTHVIDYVRPLRAVPHVDLLGESWGGGVAAEVCKDAGRARSCILASMIYKTPSAVAQAEFQSPAWLAFLQAQPNAYLQTSAPLYATLVATSPPAVQDWVNTFEPGLYTVEPLFEFFNLPFFDASSARVPGLIIQGEDDPSSLSSDVQQLAAEYGRHGAVGVVTIAGGGHIPRIDAAPHNTEFWDAVTGFIDDGE